MMNEHVGAPARMNWSRINQWVLWIGLAGAVLWLLLYHRAHLLEVSPFLLLLACPLMHLFGHGGHGGHGGGHQHGPGASSDEGRSP